MDNSFTELILNNLRKVMRDRGLTQAAIAEYAGTSASQFSKILNGTVSLSLIQLSDIATNLSMREIDLIRYPEIFIKTTEKEEDPVEAVLQIKLRKDKKDQVLKLVFGDNNIEILNK